MKKPGFQLIRPDKKENINAQMLVQEET